MTAPPHPPRTALIAKVDTLGDLVLFAPALRALATAWPETRFVVVVRRSSLDLAPLIAPATDKIEWLPTSLDPFGDGPDADPAELARLRDAVAATAPDLVVAATSRRNWLEFVLSAATQAARRVALGTELDEHFTTHLRLKLGLDVAALFSERVSIPADEPDWRRNFRLVDTLLGREVGRVRPALALTATARAAAREFLARHGLPRHGFVVCAAAGFANVALKTWPAARFAGVIGHLRDHHGLPTLLVGHESERAHLESVRTLAGERVMLWLGRDGSLPLLAALIAEAALFLGNDTGAMHLAAALDVPVVGIFGGGTWPRFVPAGRRALAVVQPLPCFGCGWDCAFGDAPCVGGIAVADVMAAVDFALANRGRDFAEIRPVEPLSTETRALMGAAAARYRATAAELVLRQRQIEEKERAIADKEAEIDALKQVCDEREQVVIRVDGHARALTAHVAQLRSEHELLQKSLAQLSAGDAATARALNDQLVHIRNVEALLQAREHELAETRASAVNLAAGLHDLERAKHYSKLLAEKEAVIQSLLRGQAEREAVIKQLSAEATAPTARLRKLWIAASAHVREKWWRPFDTWLFRHVVERYWMQIGILRHYEPRLLKWDERLLRHCRAGSSGPAVHAPARATGSGDPALQIALVTPSYNQEKFLERTMLSVLEQHYPRLLYVVQDGASRDRSAEIVARYAPRLRHWESVKDNGQADAIRRGFAHIETELGPNDLMAWLNSDDLLAPGALRFVAEYFAAHPEVDAVYGHRIIIDDDDRDVGRWIMPRHRPEALEWIDYVPQETLFWRKRAWDVVGGIDPSFQFALDWDLLARFHQARCRIVRVPYFLGAFRVHAAQKTSQDIHTTGAEEMRRIRTRFHGARQDDFATIERHARHARFWGAITARLHEAGIRW